MHRLAYVLLLGALVSTGPSAVWAQAGSAQAETPQPLVPPDRTVCPPDTTGQNPPRLGDNSRDQNLSDRLADSKGVICPPAGVDPGLSAPPPGGGRTPVIPPPGTPGGDQSVQPK